MKRWNLISEEVMNVAHNDDDDEGDEDGDGDGCFV